MNAITVSRRSPHHPILCARKSATVHKGVILRRIAQDTETGDISALVGVSLASCIRKVGYLVSKPSKASQNILKHIEHVWTTL